MTATPGGRGVGGSRASPSTVAVGQTITRMAGSARAHRAGWSTVAAHRPVSECVDPPGTRCDPPGGIGDRTTTTTTTTSTLDAQGATAWMSSSVATRSSRQTIDADGSARRDLTGAGRMWSEDLVAVPDRQSRSRAGRRREMSILRRGRGKRAEMAVSEAEPSAMTSELHDLHESTWGAQSAG